VLGYDPDASRAVLQVNEGEAQRVREIFAMFLRHGSLGATLEEIQTRGWRMKSWTTRKGRAHAGRPFDRLALQRLLRNVLYRGEVCHQGKIYPGEQAAIVDRKTWHEASELLRRGKGQTKAANPSGALLEDLLECGVCGGRMVPGYTTKGGRRYPYYVCRQAQQKGAQACPGQMIAAGRIEPAVVAGLEEWAGTGNRQPLREALRGWGGWERAEQHRILASVVERMEYDGRGGQVILRWRNAVAGEEGEKVCIPVVKRLLTEQVPPPRVEPVPAAAPPGRLPRITRLLALAVRFEDLLRNGTAKDYAELARLGGVSRSRITQIMHLRQLAPALQERILWLPASSSAAGAVTERVVRRLTQCLDWREQIKMFERLSNGRARES